jgi:dihydroorotase
MSMTSMTFIPSASRTLIQGGLLIDPFQGEEKRCDIALAQGQLVAISPSSEGPIPDFQPDQVIDAQNCLVCPGLTDLHVNVGHLSAPDLPFQQQAAYASGITQLVCSPDLSPVLDSPAWIDRLIHHNAGQNRAHIVPLGALTMGLAGEALSDMGALQDAGCVALSQGNHALPNPRVLLRAMQYAQTMGLPLHLHPKEAFLGQGTVASGAIAMRLGLSGISETAEVLALQTILELMRHVGAGARVHISRLSSRRAVAVMAQAKAEGLQISCDVSLNNLLITDEALACFDSRLHVVPVIRGLPHQTALRQGLIDGTIDAVVSDHTFMTQEGKNLPFEEAQGGAWGLSYLLPTLIHLKNSLDLSWSQVLSWVTAGPQRVLEAQSPSSFTSMTSLTSLCVFDPHVPFTNAISQSHFSPLAPDLGLAPPWRGQVKAMWQR